MKGKLILTDIQSPVEGMQAVLETQSYGTCIGQILNKSEWSGDSIKLVFANSTGYRNLSELKQIVVEDWGPTDWDGKDLSKYLPLHPNDWKWAIEHIGEEVEFEHDCKKCIDEKDNKRCDNPPCYSIAKLIHPTPVMYTEEEAKNLFYQGVAYVHDKKQIILGR